MCSNPGPGDVYNLHVDLQVDNSQIMHEAPASGGCLDLIVDTDKRLQLMISPNLQRRKSVRIASQIEASLASKLQGKGKSQGKAPLHLFMDLPLDLTYEIAKYLGPFDLLTFVRLNKRFRTVFLRRPATSVWRQCIANASLPPCPTDMTEPQYVSFMLIAGAFCMACGLDRTLKSYPTLRLRLCRKCAKKNLINGLEVCKMISELPDTSRLLSVIPSSDSYFRKFKFVDIRQARRHSYFKPEVDIIIAAYIQAKADDKCEQFFEHRQSIRDSMTAQGAKMAACIPSNALARSAPPPSCVRRYRP